MYMGLFGPQLSIITTSKQFWEIHTFTVRIATVALANKTTTMMPFSLLLLRCATEYKNMNMGRSNRESVSSWCHVIFVRRGKKFR